MPTNYHLCLSIRGELKNGEWSRMAKYATNEGKPMSADEVFYYLTDELKQGHEVIPMTKCDNFDFIKGCQGHKVEE